MTTTARLHLTVSGADRAALGRSRGEQLQGTLAEAYDWYARLFRAAGVSEAEERTDAEASLAAVRDWRPEVIDEFVGIAEASGLDLLRVVALNARTEILALGKIASKECSTVVARVGGGQPGTDAQNDGRLGHLLGAQTWDWHIELDPFWHTHEVRGPGYHFSGVTEQGIVSKIGMNSQGLALHFNILGHEQDRPGGVPMHVLSEVVLMECATVAEAVALVRAAPISSSSSLTLLDAEHAVSLELSPVGVYEVPLREGRVIRTNHFQTPEPLREQKTAFEPDSSERFELLQSRLSAGLPCDREGLVALLASDPDEPPLSCVADMSQAFGARWGTLCTVVSDPAARVLRVLDGMPTEAASGVWRELRV